MNEPHPSSKRQDIVRVAREAFYRLGFRATAVDRVLADSGISKRTVYKHFRSKEELIAAVVKDYEELALQDIEAALAPLPTPREKILSIFDLREDVISAGDITGCLAINARLEFRDTDTDIADAACSFHRSLGELFTRLCDQAGCRDPQQAGRQMLVLMMGTIVAGQSLKDPAVAQAARAAAAVLLDRWAGQA